METNKTLFYYSKMYLEEDSNEMSRNPLFVFRVLFSLPFAPGLFFP